LLSVIVDNSGVCAIQRSFLDTAHAALAPDLDPPRRMLGTPGGGSVRLAWPADCLGVAEGYETALSAMRRFGMSAAPNASPVTYSVNGRQFVAISTGGGGPHDAESIEITPEIDSGTAATTMWVFALPER
tara:strand:+ start:7943 stop:8332 length:390 start_codon:yes stop_codon:yes gene_type:complete